LDDNVYCPKCGAELNPPLHSGDAEEVERIGAYDPNKQYTAPPMQPVMSPQMQQQPPYGYGVPMPMPMRKKKQQTDYNPKGRRLAIILSVVSLVITIVALFGIPANFESFDTTLLRVGMMEGQSTILIMTFVTLAVAIVALIEPLLALGSGICLIATASLVFTGAALDIMSTPGLIVFILLAADVMVIGFVSAINMRKFVNNNLGDTQIFKACYKTWTGIPHE
jgi:hypothetical protein